MRKLKITELNRISAEEFKQVEKLPLVVVLDVLSFDLNEILLETEQGMLMVKGTDMHVNRLNLEKGEVDLAGNIDNISYSDIHSGAKAGENLLSKLFR